MIRPVTSLRTTAPRAVDVAARPATPPPPSTPRAGDRFDAPSGPRARSPAAERALDAIQLSLDVAGFIPGAGEVADVANAGISVMRGDHVGAALSLVSCIPGVGDAVAKPIKMALKANLPIPAGPARELLAALKKQGPAMINKLEDGLRGTPAEKWTLQLTGALRSSMTALEGKLNHGIRAASARSAAAGSSAAVDRVLKGALPRGAELTAEGRVARDHIVKALASKNPADARTALDSLAQFAGTTGGKTAEMKALRRQLETIATPRAPRAARAAAPTANPVDVFANGRSVDAKRLAKMGLDRVDNARAFVTHGKLGDFAQKGAHVHVRIGGTDVEVALAGKKTAAGLRLDTSMVRTASLDRIDAHAAQQAQDLVRQRLATDPAYRAGLLKAVEEALKVARKDNVSSGVLDGARLLEKALKSVGP
jgi:hypothetical protein